MANKKPPFASHTTLRACIKKSGKVFTEEQIQKLGKKSADAHQQVYGYRPLKIETEEKGMIVIISFYKKEFEAIINNLIKEA
jgi:hypothetical protein